MPVKILTLSFRGMSFLVQTVSLFFRKKKVLDSDEGKKVMCDVLLLQLVVVQLYNVRPGKEVDIYTT